MNRITSKRKIREPPKVYTGYITAVILSRIVTIIARDIIIRVPLIICFWREKN
jgi:hypothetical protein